MIHPHVLVGVPCYDLTPITVPTLDIRIIAVNKTFLGINDSHSLTGGVYKTRERIHHDMSDSCLLVIPTSWGRISALNPNWDWFFVISSTLRFGNTLYQPL